MKKKEENRKKKERKFTANKNLAHLIKELRDIMFRKRKL